jgi:hypothetical protein
MPTYDYQTFVTRLGAAMTDISAAGVITFEDMPVFPAGRGSLAGTYNVMDFGVVGDGIADDTAAIQAAIDTHGTVVFPTGNYYANNLTQHTNGQRFYGCGNAVIFKNANGPLLTSTGNYCEINGIVFNGTGYTGHNLVMQGDHPRLINSGSKNAAGRAVLATGGHVQIIGTCDIYHTSDATATGYDIEIGVAGTATLYHQITNIYTSQSTGGFLLTSTGAATITGCQFGKLTTEPGGAPSGSGGPYVTACRIVGDVLLNQSANRMVNNSIAGNVVCNEDYGEWVANAVQIGSTVTGSLPIFTIPYGQLWRMERADLTSYRSVLNMDASDNVNLGATNIGWLALNSGTAGIYCGVNNVSISQFWASGLRPSADDTYYLGTVAQRWKEVIATSLRTAGANAQATLQTQATTSLTCNSGTSTAVATNLIPAGSIVFGVTARVTTILAGTSLSTWKLGDGTTANAWGNTLALAAGTVTDSTTGTYLSTWAPTYYGSATSVTLTANAGQFDSGVVRLTVHYLKLTAATS